MIEHLVRTVCSIAVGPKITPLGGGGTFVPFLNSLIVFTLHC